MKLRMVFVCLLILAILVSCSTKQTEKCEYIRLLSSFNGGSRNMGVYITYDTALLDAYFDTIGLGISDKIIIVDSGSLAILYNILNAPRSSGHTWETLEKTVKDYMIIDFLSGDLKKIKGEILIDKPDFKMYFEEAVKYLDNIDNEDDKENIENLFNMYVRYANK